MAEYHQTACRTGGICAKLSRRNHPVHRKTGKFLLFNLDHYVMVSHLRMEGKYGLHQEEEPDDKHVHVIFTMTDGTQLRYRDVRKFGTMHLFKPGEEAGELPLSQLGRTGCRRIYECVFESTARENKPSCQNRSSGSENGRRTREHLCGRGSIQSGCSSRDKSKPAVR